MFRYPAFAVLSLALLLGFDGNVPISVSVAAEGV
jgi:hypothetical protein